MKQSYISSLIFIGVKLGANARRLNETESMQHYEDHYQTEADYLAEYGYMESLQDYVDPYFGEGNYQVEQHFEGYHDEEGEYEDEEEDEEEYDEEEEEQDEEELSGDEGNPIDDMCLQKYPFYWYLPTLSPHCCRMFKTEERSEGVVAFEDFCNGDDSFSTYLDRCERQFTNIECGEKT